MTVVVNGQVRDLGEGATVATVVAELAGAGASAGVGFAAGIAVAVNDSVVHRGTWPTTVLRDGDRVEVITAVQGG